MVSGRRVPDPFYADPISGAAQAAPGRWTRGRQLDDVTLDRYIDQPLEQIGQIARTFGQDFATWTGYYATNQIITQSVDIPWTVGRDNYNRWGLVTTARYNIPIDGLYVVGMQLVQQGAVAFSCRIGTGSGTALALIDGYVCQAVAGEGSNVYYADRLAAGIDVYFQVPSGNITTRIGAGRACYAFIQQVGY